MRKNILLVNPWIYDYTAYDLWAKPLGLLYLASCLRRCGYRIDFLDCLERGSGKTYQAGPRRLFRYGCGSFYKEHLPPPSFFRDIPRRWGRYGITPEESLHRLYEKPPPECVLITCGMTYWYPGTEAISKLVRQAFPDVPQILGGVYPTLCPEHAQERGFDGVVTSVQPERVAQELSNSWGIDLGVKSKEDFFLDPPSFELLQYNSYGVLVTSIGCPYSCNYCASSRLYQTFWRRPWKEVFEEILALNRHLGIQDFAFYDDALLYQAEDSFLPLLEALAKRQDHLRFHLPNGIHARFLTPSMARLMKRAGFCTVRVSLETTSMEILSKDDGKVDLCSFEKAVACLKEAGFPQDEIEVYLLFGLPGLKEHDYRHAVQYVRSLGLIPRFSLYSPLPGTPGLSDEFQKKSVEEPLYQNKIAYLYKSGNASLYSELQTGKVSRNN